MLILADIDGADHGADAAHFVQTLGLDSTRLDSIWRMDHMLYAVDIVDAEWTWPLPPIHPKGTLMLGKNAKYRCDRPVDGGWFLRAILFGASTVTDCDCIDLAGY